MTMMRHIRPYMLDYDTVVAEFGRVTCPYCESQSTDDRESDIGWVECPISHTPRRVICLGCCEDIYSACAADDFESHPYYNIVEAAAAKEGITVNKFRYECLQQQLRSAQERREKEATTKYDERAARLRRLVEKLPTA
ncbi:MAG: hypothetical protein KatS3mg111_2097 [Pirellulaceae bacterium]|nr:MAG: hypothetical protein KatS3mg111_2097 [Pirellulaceae bacterium]